MKNKVLAISLLVGIYVPMILVTYQELTGVTIPGIEGVILMAGVAIFAIVPLAAIQLIRSGKR